MHAINKQVLRRATFVLLGVEHRFLFLLNFIFRNMTLSHFG